MNRKTLLIRYGLVVLLTAILVVLATACGHEDEPEPTPSTPPQEQTTPRTVLVYMVAQNNLSSYSTRDLSEIKQAIASGHLGNSRLLIYLDDNNSTPTLFEFEADGERNILADYDDETLSVSVSRMSQVIDDAKRIAPARHYGLIMWGHGTGYLQNGIEEDTLSPLSYGGEEVSKVSYWMNTTSMARALKGKGLDWIYFDCCFMAGVEVAYELRDVTDYIIASATELPAVGMPYHLTLRHLMPEQSDLQGAAAETFGYFNGLSGSSRTCTISLIDTSAIEQLAQTVRTVLTNTAGLPDDYTPQAFQTTDDHNRYGWSYYDFQHYLLALAGTNTGYQDMVKSSIERAVVYAAATPKLWNDVPLLNHCGLSTFIVERADDPDIDRKGYRELSWWNDVVSHRFK
ncbi:MAG: hypothetical protein K2N28_03075 [Muribaculaceae bacterium]|nr:hypothetical protein [Muribaculaceae bacterium]